MNRSTLIASGIAVLLAGALAYTLIRQGDMKTDTGAKAMGGGTVSAETARPSANSDPNQKAARERQRREAEASDLVAKYGESRTNLSKHVTGNVVSLLDDAIQMGEMATTNRLGGPFGGRGAWRMGLGRVSNELNLTEEQQQKAGELYSEFQKRELAKSKEAVERLRKDPETLMKLMLASDAFARGEISEADYKAAQNASGEARCATMNS
jgi:hypothetical protein